jgi:hypothetical protein
MLRVVVGQLRDGIFEHHASSSAPTRIASSGSPRPAVIIQRNAKSINLNAPNNLTLGPAIP